MSLILEALRKLDREKNAPQRGFVVLASPVAAPRRRWLNPRAVVAAAVFGLAALSAVLLAPRLQPPPRPAVTTPAARAPRHEASLGLSTGTTPEPAAALVPAAPATLPPASRQPQAARPVASAAPEAPGLTAASPLPMRTAAEPGPDPTAATLVLEAIAVRDGHKVAVLSGRLVREGDVFGATRVLRIGDSEVEIESHGQRRVLRF